MEGISVECSRRLYKSKWLVKEMCGIPTMPIIPRGTKILQAPAKPDSPVQGNANAQSQAVNLDGSSFKAVTRIGVQQSEVDERTIDINIEAAKKQISDVEEEPFCALLNHSAFPLASLDDVQKLAWLRSQLIGEEREFSTPFGKRILIYADHAASGKSLFFIEDFITKHLLPFYGNTHTDDSYVGRRTSKLMRQAEEYIKERMGGSEEDALLMCGWGCTAAIKRLQEVMGIAVPSILRGHLLNMMQESLTHAPTADNERWLVFVGPYEHHSNLLSWRQSLAEVREIRTNENGLIDMERLEAELQAAEAAGRRRKLGAFSACSNVTGLLTNTRSIARLLHKYGAFAVFDFAAGAPHLQIDMRSGHEDGYDAVVMSPHKFLGGPGTPGLLLMSKRLYMLKNKPPSTCGGGTVAYVNGFNEKDTLYYEEVEEREEGGTPPIVGKIRCALAVWLKEAMGVPLIRLREAFYLTKAMKRLSTHPNIHVLGGQAPSRVPILSFLIKAQIRTMQGKSTHFFGKPLHGRFVVNLLNDLFGIQARGGCACAGPYGHYLLGVNEELSLAIRHAIQMGYEGLKPGWARLGLCYSMTEEEVDYILSAIEFVADHGLHFLPLYGFDWQSGNWTYNSCTIFQSSIQALVERHENDMSRSRRLGLRKYLRRAKALSQLLPRSPLPKPIPNNVDPKLLLFSL